LANDGPQTLNFLTRPFNVNHPIDGFRAVLDLLFKLSKGVF